MRRKKKKNLVKNEGMPPGSNQGGNIQWKNWIKESQIS